METSRALVKEANGLIEVELEETGRAVSNVNRGPKVDRANVLGVGVHAVNLSLAAEMIDQAIDADGKGYVCVAAVSTVMEAQYNRDFKDILDRAMLVVPDGVPTVWIGRWEGYDKMARVFGPDLMMEVCRRSVATGRKHFLYGGKPGVAEELKQNLEARCPGICIVGTYTPPFRPLSIAEKTELQEQLLRLAPHIVWVGISTPKQERFMAENLGSLNCKVMVGVGAAFDFHSGRLKDAPQWIKVAGLQWLHRLCQEPSRLWRRYLFNNSGFLFRTVLQLTGIKRYELSSPEIAAD
jgi:N-acetylglucosaminyldiphosphoundecaprenol N-acetyl-beta-D-mannosaminyltransferase